VRLHASTTVAGEVLRIEDTGNAGWIRFDNQGTAKGFVGFGDNNSLFAGAGAQSLAVRAESALHLGGSSTLTMTLTGGNAGIGTTAPAGKLDVNGTIFQRGVLLHADYVFEPTYALESIEEHSAFMWNNKHLPALGARTVDEKGQEVVEIGTRMRGMLEELEKAHIYISMLSDRLAEKDESLVKLERQNAELADRLSRIEAMLSASKTEKK
jgi:hypothetical protein